MSSVLASRVDDKMVIMNMFFWQTRCSFVNILHLILANERPSLLPCNDGLTELLLGSRTACAVVSVLANMNLDFLTTQGFDQPYIHTYNPVSSPCNECLRALNARTSLCVVEYRTLITALVVRLNCMRHSSAGPESRLLWVLPRNPQHPHCSSTLHSVPVSTFALLIISGGHLFVMSKMWEVDPETRSKVRCGVSSYIVGLARGELERRPWSTVRKYR